MKEVLVFLFLTVIIFGGASFLMGQAIAETWRPVWQNVVYGVLLVAAERFFAWCLFQAPAFNIGGILLNAVVIIGFALLAYRLTQVRKMVSQYPWLYERAGLFSWRDKATTGG
jgi:branched-chain amino acid transport system ATP-binding protein